jgi:predicted regulator of Ras-like GTPase activity (Roadblock/LC7/MglB family)
MRTAFAPFLLVLALALVPGLGAQSSWNGTLPATLDAMAEKHWQPSLQTAFGTFTFEYSELATPFSRWLEDELGGAMAKSSKLRLFNRNVASAMDPAFKEIYGEFFKTNGVDALLAGKYFDEGETVRARVELTGMSDGVLLGTADLRIPKRSIPASVAVSPTPAATSTVSQLSSLVPQELATGALSASVSTERGKGAVYREGEDMVILVTVSQEAYLKVYHIDAKGVLQLIWPNRFGGGGTIKPGTAVRIPGQNDPFVFRMTPPFGTEFIKVVASTLPFAQTEADFSAIGGDARKSITRGITVIGTDASTGSGPLAHGLPASSGTRPSMAEATASYVITEAKR